MASGGYGPVIREVGRLLAGGGTAAALGEEQLLRRFAADRDEAAFEALISRHGPMVLATCRRMLAGPHDVEDAFQATFLVLARRAGSIRDGGRLGPWLHGVARRVAARSRALAARRDARERPGVEDRAVAEADRVEAVELRSALDEELARLPEKYRAPLVLCYLEGLTHDEAAIRLNWPVGTVRTRLAGGRDRLRSRLTRRGLAPSTAVPAFLPAAAIPRALMSSTVRVATCAGSAPAHVAIMAKGALVAMIWHKSRAAAAACLLAGLTVGGAGTPAQFGGGDKANGPPEAAGPAEQPARSADPRDGPAAGDSAATARPMSRGKVGGKSLLTNGGAEDAEGDSPKAWTSGATIPGGEYIWSRDAGHAGRASLCLKKTAQRYFPIAQWSQKVDREGDAPRLRVSAWVKAEKAGKAILDAQFIDGAGKWSHAWVAYIGAREANDPPVSHDWKRYEGIVAIPPGAKQIVIAPQVYGPGTVWFDDLDAEYTNDAATDPTGS